MSITASQTAFTENGVKVGGYLARPDSEVHRAAVIIIHEWYGLNRHLEDVAERYAKNGYLAFSIDLYDGELAKDDGEAAAMMSALDQEKALNYLKATVAHLRSQPGIERVGVTGFCMGEALHCGCLAKRRSMLLLPFTAMFRKILRSFPA